MKLNITKVIVECTYDDKEAKFEFDNVEQAELIIVNRNRISAIQAEEGEGEAVFSISNPSKIIKRNGKENIKDTSRVSDSESEDSQEQTGKIQEAIIE